MKELFNDHIIECYLDAIVIIASINFNNEDILSQQVEKLNEKDIRIIFIIFSKLIAQLCNENNSNENNCEQSLQSYLTNLSIWAQSILL